MRDYKPTSLAERATFVQLWRGGLSARAISQESGKSVNTVCRWLRRWRREGSIFNRPHNAKPFQRELGSTLFFQQFPERYSEVTGKNKNTWLMQLKLNERLLELDKNIFKSFWTACYDSNNYGLCPSTCYVPLMDSDVKKNERGFNHGLCRFGIDTCLYTL